VLIISPTASADKVIRFLNPDVTKTSCFGAS
jgi:hypothetical protein